jgi:hypothetical protein
LSPVDVDNIIDVSAADDVSNKFAETFIFELALFSLTPKTDDTFFAVPV